MRLSVKLPLLVCATVTVTAAAAGIISVRAVSSSVEREARQSATERVTTYASAVRSHLDDSALTLRVMARDLQPAGAPTGVDRLRASARGVIGDSDVFEYVMRVDRGGAIDLVEPAALEATLTTRAVAHQRWYRDAVASGDTVVSDLFVSAATKRPSVVIVTPWRASDGEVSGHLVGGLRLDSFSRFAQAVDPDDRGASSGLLTDSRGLIIAHQANPSYVAYQTDFSSVPPVRWALAGSSGSGRWVNPIEQVEKIGAYASLERPHWSVVVGTPTSVALAPAATLARTIGGAAVALVVVLGVGLTWLIRRFTQPLRELTDVSARVGSGETDIRAPVLPGELGEVARQFNAMLDALAVSERDLRRRAGDLQSLNRELDAFAYSVSHDLRAPLRSIDGFSQVLLEDYGPALDEEGQEHLERVRAAAQRMGGLIDDLLTLSRATQGELVIAPVDVSALATRVLDELRAADPDRAVAVDVEPGLVVDADERLAEVALRNLLGNAWKFTSATPDAAIRVGATEPAGTFFVADNGAGFDMAHADRLFAPFMRLHHTSEFPGSGIGLATVSRVLRRHGGSIRADSAPGAGATFTFRFGPDPVDAVGPRRGDHMPAPTDTVPCPEVGSPDLGALVPERQP